MLSVIKKQFFAFRNGIVADALRKAGMPYKVIFGLQVPQIAEIARGIRPDMTTADELWADSTVRESRLLASYIYPHEEMTLEKGLEIARGILTREEADMLAFRLFKRLPFAASLLEAMRADTGVSEYAVAALEAHLC